jgi:sulfur relay (sulfurtransferase) complex TusBCD TusD component (DsrE family)
VPSERGQEPSHLSLIWSLENGDVAANVAMTACSSSMRRPGVGSNQARLCGTPSQLSRGVSETSDPMIDTSEY